jgi:16S rRNA C967 or C1407 C5-methylase (RsmB/RsmF family)
MPWHDHNCADQPTEIIAVSLESAAKEIRYKKSLLELLAKTYSDRTLKVLEALRRSPKEYAVRVNTLRTNADEVMERFSQMGVVCRRSEVLEEAILIKVQGPYAVRREGKQIVAEKGAAESVMMGSKLYAPGILRTDKYRVGEGVYITDIYDHVVGRGIALIPPKVNSKKGRGLAVDTTETVYRLPPFREGELYKKGMIREQSLPAMITSRVLDPQKGETVVDMCAAPGGKALHIAQLMEGRGVIYAFDHSEKRLNALRVDVERLGAHNIRVFCSDARYLDRDFSTLKADRVLVDPPCSALGVRPKLYEDATVDEVLGCAEYQRQFLRVAGTIVKRGGTIVYSTCTLTLEENEDIAKFAMEELGLELEDQGIRIGEPGFGVEIYRKAQRFSPDVLEMPGYFIAKFRK